MLIKYLNVLIILLSCSIAAERICEKSRWFRDRQGNEVRLQNCTAIFKAANSNDRVSILTKKGFDVSKIISHYERSYVLLYAGRFKGRIGKPPGDLYVFYTEQPKYCNGSAVAYKVFGDRTITDLKQMNAGINNKYDDVEIKFRNSERIIITRGILTNLLSKMNHANYYDSLYCRGNEKSFDCSKDNFADKVELNYEKILSKHREIVDKTMETVTKNIKLLEMKLRKCGQNRVPQNSAVSEVRYNEFRRFLNGKFEEMCNLTNPTRVVVLKAESVIDLKTNLDKCLEREKLINRSVENEKRVMYRFDDYENDDEWNVVLEPLNALNTTDYGCIQKKDHDNCNKILIETLIDTVFNKKEETDYGNN